MASYEKTLGDMRNELSLKQISGVCSSSDEFTALINEASESLARRGGWFDLEQRITFRIRGCRLVWPHFVGTVLGVRMCDGGLATMSNQWFSFLNGGQGGNWRNAYGFNGPLGLNGFGNYGGYGVGAYGGFSGTGKNGVVIEDDGTRPTYNEIPNQTGCLIRYSVVNKNDYGKTITLFGKQYGGQILQEDDGTGTTINGLTLTAGKPYGQSSQFITNLESITREPTESLAYLYAYDPALDIQYDLAVFLPQETNPRYRCSRIINGLGFGNNGNGNGQNGECASSIEALVKLKLFPVKYERDFLPISCVRAIKLAMQAVTLEQSNNDSAAQSKWLLAVEELNLEQGTVQPARNAPIRINLGRPCFSPI